MAAKKKLSMYTRQAARITFMMRRALGGDISAGATVKLQKDADDEYYVIDLIDLEQVAPPLIKPDGYISIDLLQKSFEVEFKVVNSRDQIEAQGKPFSTITISLTQNTKHFQLTEYMFNHNPFPCQTPIALFFSFCQRMIFRFLEGCLAIFMKFR